MSLHHSPKIVTNGLVLCLDAGNRKSYPGLGEIWQDVGGNNYNGTLIDGAVFSLENKGNITFNGSTSYVSSTYSINSRPFSINIWFYFNTFDGSWHTFVNQDTSQATNLGAFYFQKVFSGGGAGGRIGNTIGLAMTNISNSEIYCYDPNPILIKIWYNYCVSVSTSDITLYKNGIEVNKIINSDTLATTTGPLIIGAGYYTDTIIDFFNGKIAQLGIYNRALSASEILQNYNATKGRFQLT